MGKEIPYKVLKKYTDDDLRSIQGELLESELEKSKDPEREYHPSSITITGDIGRDDIPGPYFSWNVSGEDPQKLLKTNKILYDALIKFKKRKK